MRAARFYGAGKPLELEDVPMPEPGESGIVVRVRGAGDCHSDLHIIESQVPLPSLPLTLGHENAGVVDSVGPGIEGIRPGDAVAVFGDWGCGRCRVCVRGEENLCATPSWPGIRVDGGWAEYLLVPHARHLLPLGTLDPIQAAPLTDAGLTPYRAVRKALPHLCPGDVVAAIGVGGLGHRALQILRALAPAARLVAIDQSGEKLALARELGAEITIDARGDAVREIRRATEARGASAVLDFVGSEQTLRTATAAAATGGIVVLCGIAGGSIPFSFRSPRAECVLTTSAWGTRAELEDVLRLAQLGHLRPHVERQPLEAVNDVVARLQLGGVRGRVVLTP